LRAAVGSTPMHSRLLSVVETLPAATAHHGVNDQEN
jgi:hypothetical protein